MTRAALGHWCLCAQVNSDMKISTAFLSPPLRTVTGPASPDLQLQRNVQGGETRTAPPHTGMRAAPHDHPSPDQGDPGVLLLQATNQMGGRTPHLL